MPTVLRIGPYRFHFYVADGHEPPHMHVDRDDKELKIWLRPVRLARNDGFTNSEARKIVSHAKRYELELLRAWYVQFPGQK